ncbi:hypothetical protein BDZ97DRAFT_740580 [Flammula alnicola]|nr:hypothetical protein BDZ97DRAFT_740580 [Flammula alnicola]
MVIELCGATCLPLPAHLPFSCFPSFLGLQPFSSSSLLEGSHIAPTSNASPSPLSTSSSAHARLRPAAERRRGFFLAHLFVLNIFGCVHFGQESPTRESSPLWPSFAPLVQHQPPVASWAIRKWVLGFDLTWFTGTVGLALLTLQLLDASLVFLSSFGWVVDCRLHLRQQSWSFWEGLDLCVAAPIPYWWSLFCDRSGTSGTVFLSRCLGFRSEQDGCSDPRLRDVGP